MPKIDMEAYESAGGGFKQLLPGAYVATVMQVVTEFEEMDWDLRERVTRTADNDQAVMFVFDIAEGEFCGEFSRDYYMEDGKPAANKTWMHQFKYSWAPESMRDFKRFNQVLEDSNPGFNVMAAFQADRWDMYVGKKFGIVLNGTVSTNDNGYDKWTLRPGWRTYTVDEVRDGKTPAPRITDRRTPVPEAEEPESTPYDVPF